MISTVTSNNNGLITPNAADFQMAARYWYDEAPNVIQHYNYSDAATAFGLDPDSVIVEEATEADIFVDPENHDYHLLSPATFPNMGYYAYSGNIGFYSSGGNTYILGVTAV